jgi:Spy/CpxP family protein refolding chaperone
MIAGILFGALGGFAATTFILRRRAWRMHRGFHGPRLFHVLRELELDRRQREQLREIFEDVRHAAFGLRSGRWDALADLADAVAADAFDRARAEQVIGRKEAALAEVKRRVLDGLGRAHDILSAEQRARLRNLFTADAVSAGGPYR